MEWVNGKWVDWLSAWIVQYWLRKWYCRMSQVIVSVSFGSLEIVDNNGTGNIKF